MSNATQIPKTSNIPNLEDSHAHAHSQTHAQNEVPKKGQEAEIDFEDIPNPFSTKRPKDCISGVGSGLGNVFKGIGFGIAGLFAAPIVGAAESGASGLFKGLFMGVISVVGLPVFGLFSGVVQVTRGILNTPEAIKEQYIGKKIWDKQKRIWVEYNLKTEAELVLNETEAAYLERMKNEKNGIAKEDTNVNKAEGVKLQDNEKKPKVIKNLRKVKDMKYYNLLEIDSDATPGDIKKAYYLRARKLHPDKNPNDPAAKQNFQLLSAAYQVLSDPNLRQKYDDFGADSVADIPVMDSTEMYMLIFGSPKFSQYVGELKLAMLMMLGEESENQFLNPFSNRKIEYRQQKREVQCATNLAQLLDLIFVPVASFQTNPSSPESPTLESSDTQFLKQVRSDAAELAQTAIGAALLAVIGRSYQTEARVFLGFKYGVKAGLGVERAKRKAHGYQTQYKFLVSALNGVRTARRNGMFKDEEKTAETKVKKEGKPEETKTEEEKMLDGLLVMMETLWRVTVIDVESTIKSVCKKVLYDSSVSLENRINRAKGLELMGQMFREKGRKSEDGLKEMKEKLKNDLKAQQEAAKMYQAENAEYVYEDNQAATS